MNHLKQIQHEFQEAIDISNTEFLDNILETKSFNKSQRLAVYRDGYRLRLIEALQIDYPKVLAVLGVEVFNDIVEKYIASTPSHFRSLRWYGADFSSWLRQHSGRPDSDALSELAAFEWLLLSAFDSADEPLINCSDLIMLSPEEWPVLKLYFHSSLHLICLRYNVVPVWQSLEQSQDPPSFHQYTAPQQWRIWRQDGQSYFKSMDASEYAALESMRQQQPFAEMCFRLSEFYLDEEAPHIAMQLLKTWLEEQLITSYSIVEV